MGCSMDNAHETSIHRQKQATAKVMAVSKESALYSSSLFCSSIYTRRALSNLQAFPQLLPGQPINTINVITTQQPHRLCTQSPTAHTRSTSISRTSLNSRLDAARTFLIQSQITIWTTSSALSKPGHNAHFIKFMPTR